MFILCCCPKNHHPLRSLRQRKSMLLQSVHGKARLSAAPWAKIKRWSGLRSFLKALG